MIDPVQGIVGIVVLVICVGGLLFLFYSRTNPVEKTGYGALIMLAIISLMIPVFWIMETNNQAQAKADQQITNIQRGVALYAQYCYECHGTKGQGRSGPKLNGNPAVNSMTDDDLLRIISAGIYDTSNPTNPLMPAWSERYGGPLTDTDIQNLFYLIRSADPAYQQKNGYSGEAAKNAFGQIAQYMQLNNPSGLATAQAQEGAGQFGQPVDMTKSKAITIDMVPPKAGQSCSPSCYDPINVKVKVGTTITWVNSSSQPHTVTAMPGSDPNNEKPAPNIFDSGISKGIATGGKYTYTVTTAAYNFNPNHVLLYYCQYHPAMVAVLTIVP
jgi:plastocyanin/mono/diheme cytochrome c family protein